MPRKNRISIVLEADDKASPAAKSMGRKVDAAFDRMKAKAKAVSASMATSLQKMKGSITAVGVASAAMAAAVIAGTAKMVSSTAEVGDQFHKMSLRTGESVEALVALQYAAEISGTNIETVEKGLRFLSKTMLDFSRGTGESKKTLEALGLTVLDTDGKLKSTISFMNEVSDKLANMTDATKQAAFASELFGSRAGTQLLPLLKEGASGIDELMEKARELGIVFDQEGAAAAAEYTDRMHDLQMTMKGVTRLIGFELLPVITAIVVGMRDWILANKDLIKQNFPGYVDRITGAIASAVKVMRFFHNAWSGIKLAGQLALEGIAMSLQVVIRGLRVMLKPLDLIYAGLVKIGAVKVNPFDKAQEAIDLFRVTTSEVRSEVLDDISKTNAAYDKMGAAIDRVRNKMREAAPAAMPVVGGGGTAAAASGGAAETSISDIAAAEIEIHEEIGERKVEIAERTANRIKDIEEATGTQRLMFAQSMASGIAETFQMIAEAGGKQSKEAFMIYKAAAIAEAIISSSLAIMQVFADKTIPSTIAKGIMAGVIAAKMGIQMAMIANAAPPSYDQGGISRTPGMYYAGVPEAHIPLKGGSVPVEIKQKPSEVVIINTPTFESFEAFLSSSRGVNAIVNAVGSQREEVRRIIR